jgi:hypothetical protein
VLSEEEIRQSESRKSALELRFKELKQESLNVILTDTLSISKMLPAEKDRPHQHPSSKDIAGSIKNMAARPKSEYLPSEPNAKHSLKAEGTESF